jgi:hypothetical protein
MAFSHSACSIPTPYDVNWNKRVLVSIFSPRAVKAASCAPPAARCRQAHSPNPRAGPSRPEARFTPDAS